MVTADVDADFRHRLDRKRVHVAGWFRACANDAEVVIERGTQEAFGKVRAATVAGAEDEDGRWFHDVGG